MSLQTIRRVVRHLRSRGYNAILRAFPDLRVDDVDEARRQLAAVG